MNYEVLQTIWFLLIAILYIGFFFLEGFDFGVGMLLPFLGKDDKERRAIINTIGPHWDGNEVWLLTAGGATFAAFPIWYGSLFSGFYLALFVLLLALIVRGVAFEFRSKDANPKWRTTWDWGIFAGSLQKLPNPRCCATWDWRPCCEIQMPPRARSRPGAAGKGPGKSR